MTRSPARSLLLLSTVLLAVVLGGTVPAAAHDGEGDLAVTASEPVDGTGVRFQVRLTYVADGHGATDATVTAVAEGPAGQVAPQPLTPMAEEGDYEAVVRFPAAGAWDVRFTSVTPPATGTASITVPPPTSSATEGPTTTTTGSGDPAAAAPTDPDAVPGPEDDDDPVPGSLVFAGVLVALLVLGGLVVRSVRRARSVSGRPG